MLELGLFKLSEDLNVFIQHVGRTPDDDDDIKKKISATELSFQMFPAKKACDSPSSSKETSGTDSTDGPSSKQNDCINYILENKKNFHDVLRVKFGDKEFKKSVHDNYKSMSRLVHPDKCSHPRAKDAFQVLGSAYKSLEDSYTGEEDAVKPTLFDKSEKGWHKMTEEIRQLVMNLLGYKGKSVDVPIIAGHSSAMSKVVELPQVCYFRIEEEKNSSSASVCSGISDMSLSDKSLDTATHVTRRKLTWCGCENLGQCPPEGKIFKGRPTLSLDDYPEREKECVCGVLDIKSCEWKKSKVSGIRSSPAFEMLARYVELE
eukprot:GHVP01027994.1.p1 GENE.GHVP01027994.1~~GHVP01027994.1.p1  ORF type:complete len:318 (-),score=28.17 GHVP01027994.1:247-1200(-)